jgi:hypothetical protein
LSGGLLSAPTIALLAELSGGLPSAPTIAPLPDLRIHHHFFFVSLSATCSPV